MVNTQQILKELAKAHPRERLEKILLLLQQLDEKKNKAEIKELKKVLEQSKKELAMMREWDSSGGGLEQSLPSRMLDPREVPTPERTEQPQQGNVLEETLGTEPSTSGSTGGQDLYSSAGSNESGDELYGNSAKDAYEDASKPQKMDLGFSTDQNMDEFESHQKKSEKYHKSGQ